MAGEVRDHPSLFGDSHMHTELCKHAQGTPEEYAERAVERGLERICFTCHSPMPDDFWPWVRMDVGELPLYLDMIDECRRNFDGRLLVLRGLEADFFPGTETWMERLLDQLELDHVLGSVHFQGPEYQRRYQTGDHDEFVRTYFNLLAESAETGLFDTLAHPDLVKNSDVQNWDYHAVEPAVLDALDRIAGTGVAMEFNTSGRCKRSGEFNPSPRMLKSMAEREIPVVLGSDAHVPERVGDAFDEALELIEQAGYREVSLFSGRRRHAVPIERARRLLKVEPSAAA